jgi:hypothetical protein
MQEGVEILCICSTLIVPRPFKNRYNSIRGDGGKAYGRERLSELTVDQRETLVFDLRNLDAISGNEDLREILDDGYLNVVYADDAIIHNAQLLVDGNLLIEAQEIDQTQISSAFDAYISTVRGPRDSLVGFDGNVIDGRGSEQNGSISNGVDEIVAFSFDLPNFLSVDDAHLILDITPKAALITTDELLFANNNSIRGDGGKAYGREQLSELTVDERETLVFDLRNLGTSSGNEDLRGILDDGYLDVVYADDAIIHSAKLLINGNLLIA